MAKKRRAGAKRKSWKYSFSWVMGVALAILFMPTTFLLCVGMVPTLVAVVTDPMGRGSKALTVGAMNLAGTTPFLFHLWVNGHNMDKALEVGLAPMTIVVIYGAAAIGYLINWALSGIVATLIVQRSHIRVEEIKKRQGALVERWGEKVTGKIPLDSRGFPRQTQGAQHDEDIR